MAKLTVVSVYDVAVEAFGRPVVVTAKGAAIRSFLDECSNPESEISKHPTDYILYEVGSFDDGLGQFENVHPPVRLVAGNKVDE